MLLNVNLNKPEGGHWSPPALLWAQETSPVLLWAMVETDIPCTGTVYLWEINTWILILIILSFKNDATFPLYQKSWFYRLVEAPLIHRMIQLHSEKPMTGLWISLDMYNRPATGTYPYICSHHNGAITGWERNEGGLKPCHLLRYLYMLFLSLGTERSLPLFHFILTISLWGKLDWQKLVQGHPVGRAVERIQ